jgi:hypothetical protein
MAESTVTVNLPSIDGLIEAIGTAKLKVSMSGAATVVSGEVRRRWLSGSGADQTKFSPGSKDYLAWKASKGRTPKIDMMFKGDMALSFIPRRQTDTEVEITFSNDQLDKARSNFSLRPNMLKVNASLEKIGINAFLKSLRSLVKFTK